MKQLYSIPEPHSFRSCRPVAVNGDLRFSYGEDKAVVVGSSGEIVLSNVSYPDGFSLVNESSATSHLYRNSTVIQEGTRKVEASFILAIHSVGQGSFVVATERAVYLVDEDNHAIAISGFNGLFQLAEDWFCIFDTSHATGKSRIRRFTSDVSSPNELFLGNPSMSITWSGGYLIAISGYSGNYEKVLRVIDIGTMTIVNQSSLPTYPGTTNHIYEPKLVSFGPRSFVAYSEERLMFLYEMSSDGDINLIGHRIDREFVRLASHQGYGDGCLLVDRAGNIFHLERSDFTKRPYIKGDVLYLEEWTLSHQEDGTVKLISPS